MDRDIMLIYEAVEKKLGDEYENIFYQTMREDQPGDVGIYLYESANDEEDLQGQEVYNCISNDNITQINDYIKAPMTATWFNEQSSKGRGRSNSEQVTSELIYYWMVALNIPFECQKWHLNRLLTLVRVCEIKNRPNKKPNKKDTMRRYAELNAANRKRFNSKG